MKKAKIFLTALTVLAVVSGALAFKVKQQFHYAATCDIPNQVCTLDDFFSFATTDPNGAPADFDVFGAPCKPGNICATLTIESD